MSTSLRPLIIVVCSSKTSALARSFRPDLSWRVGTPDTGRQSSSPFAFVFRMQVHHFWKDVPSSDAMTDGMFGQAEDIRKVSLPVTVKVRYIRRSW